MKTTTRSIIGHVIPVKLLLVIGVLLLPVTNLYAQGSTPSQDCQTLVETGISNGDYPAGAILEPMAKYEDDDEDGFWEWDGETGGDAPGTGDVIVFSNYTHDGVEITAFDWTYAGTLRNTQAVAGYLVKRGASTKDIYTFAPLFPNSGSYAIPSVRPAPSYITFCHSLADLPVELTSFEATVDGQDVILRWRTASETNNAGFDVQMREADGADKTWYTLTFVEGHGTTELPKAYRHRATTLNPGAHVFRLRQVDFDGTFEYSPEVEVVIGLPGQYVIEPVYPNPFNPEATLRFAVQREQRVEVGLYNLMGQRVKTLFAGTATSGQMQQVAIDGSGLSSGVYLLRVRGERFLETQRVTLVR
jgi:hypothetical protein